MYNKLKKDLKLAIKMSDNIKRDTIRLVISELLRAKRKAGKIPDDFEVINVIKKLISIEEELLTKHGKDYANIDFINVLKNYLPNVINKETIVEWINENIDFSKLKNNMQAIGLVKKHFGVFVDGSLVRNIIIELGE